MIYSRAFEDWWRRTRLEPELKEQFARIWNDMQSPTPNPADLLTEIVRAAQAPDSYDARVDHSADPTEEEMSDEKLTVIVSVDGPKFEAGKDAAAAISDALIERGLAFAKAKASRVEGKRQIRMTFYLPAD